MINHVGKPKVVCFPNKWSRETIHVTKITFSLSGELSRRRKGIWKKEFDGQAGAYIGFRN